MKISIAHLLFLGPNVVCLASDAFARAVDPVHPNRHGDGDGGCTHGTGSEGGSSSSQSNSGDTYIPGQGSNSGGSRSQACNRADYTRDLAYTFNSKDYAAKGKQIYREAMYSKKLDNHDYAKKVEEYKIVPTAQLELKVDIELGTLFKQQGIGLNHPLESNKKLWTKYEVYGAKKIEELTNKQSVMEMWVSVKHKAIYHNSAFKNDDSLYEKGFPKNDKLPMSEFIWQLWKEAVADGKAHYNVDIKESDLGKIFVTDVENAEARAIVNKAYEQFGKGKERQPFVNPADNAANDALEYSSMGHALVDALKDHNVESQLNGLKIKEIRAQLKDKSDTASAGVFIMGR